MTPVMLDLFSGRGGASRAMVERGWRVISIDLDPKFRPSIVADASFLPVRGDAAIDLLWASPPCTEFSKTDMPWFKDPAKPDLELVETVFDLVRTIRPRYWILENVRGAIKHLGPPRERHHPIFLWGEFPPLQYRRRPYKEKRRHDDPSYRAEIPYDMSWAVASSVEAWIGALPSD